jgi:hypothetical protein
MKKIVILIVLVLVGVNSSLIFNDAAEARVKKKKIKWVKSKWGLNALMTFSSDRNKMIKAYNLETKTYDKCLKAIKNETIKSGDTSAFVTKKVGEPVITIKADDSDNMEWLYKPGFSDHPEKEKVYLVFSPEGILLDWKIPSVSSTDG